MPDSKKFWQFRNQADNTVELLLYGDISQTSWWGDEVTPKQFADELAGLGALDKIVVRINSGGGDVFAAQAIGNLLEQHPAEVSAKIDGLCASAGHHRGLPLRKGDRGQRQHLHGAPCTHRSLWVLRCRGAAEIHRGPGGHQGEHRWPVREKDGQGQG